MTTINRCRMSAPRMLDELDKVESELMRHIESDEPTDRAQSTAMLRELNGRWQTAACWLKLAGVCNGRKLDGDEELNDRFIQAPQSEEAFRAEFGEQIRAYQEEEREDVVRYSDQNRGNCS